MFSHGWLESAQKVVSPHFNSRPESSEVSLLVIHNISLPPNQFKGNYVEEFFSGNLNHREHEYFHGIKDLKVSSHFYIRRDGQIIQFVPIDKRAWHAGVSSFEGSENCNDFSIGIEMAGGDHIPYTSKQYLALKFLTLAIKERFPKITSDRIVGHCDIAPGRKTDPGRSFDWERYLNDINS